MNYQDNNDMCLAPWNLLRIEADGNCYSCSSAYVKDLYSFGNIFTDDIHEIWYGEKAAKFREDKLKKEYNYCKIDQCHLFAKNMNYFSSEQLNHINYPKYVSLSYDNSCSERCIFCRDEIICLDNKTANKWETILHSKIIPLLQNANILEITCAGELFSSVHSQKIVKEIIKTYPNLKLKLFSNGILFTEEKLKDLGILDNIDEICISLHCTNSSTYKKIFRNDNFNKVMKNVEFIADMKKTGKIKNFCLQFVINKHNYKEIKSFIKKAKELGATPVFNYISDTTGTVFTKNMYNYAVYNPKHFLYNSYVKVLEDKFVQENVPDFMRHLKTISTVDIIKNYISYIIYLKRNRG